MRLPTATSLVLIVILSTGCDGSDPASSPGGSTSVGAVTDEGIVIGPSDAWSEPETLTRWISDDAALAIFHGSAGGYYALDLSGPRCPAGLELPSLEVGGGLRLDTSGLRIIFDCADGSVLGWFDREGRPGEGNGPGAIDPLPAYRVAEGEGGTLVVLVDEPVGSVSEYWA